MISTCPVKSTVVAAAYHLAPAELVKAEPSDERRQTHATRGRLGGREHAAVDAAQDDERRAERPDLPRYKGPEEDSGAEWRFGFEAVLLRIPDHRRP